MDYEIVRILRGTEYENGYEATEISCHRKACGGVGALPYPDGEDCWNCPYYKDLKREQVFEEYGEIIEGD